MHSAACLVAALLVAAGAAGAAGAAVAAPSQADEELWRPLAASSPIPTSKDVPFWEETTPSLIAKYNYKSETHTIETADGYLLTVHRIPNPGKEVVLLQHGLLCSSADWVVIGPQKALAFLLHDAGYDVWMGNARGNKYSRGHVKYSTKNAKYWDFSWHEMGMYDLPAMIDDILLKTTKKKLTYIGHSQGTTSFFVMASLLPEYNEKIRAMHALAPIAYMTHIKSAPLKFISKEANSIGFIANVLGMYEFLPTSAFLSKFETAMCANGAMMQPVCTNALFVMVGFDTDTLDTEKIPDITANAPAGSSTKQFVHYGQLIGAAKETFRQFDDGLLGNLLKYKSISPPEYPVEKITAPVHLHYADNDLLGVPECSKILSEKLPNVKVRKVPLEKFNHIDFLWSKDVVPLLYEPVIESIQDQLLD